VIPAIAVVVALLAPGLAPASHAQTLQLDPAAQAPPLPSPTATERLGAALQEELRGLAARSDDDPFRQTVRDARITLRRVAFDLLVRSDRSLPGDPSIRDAIGLYGLRIADARRRIDVLLESFADGSIAVGAPPRPLGVRERDRARRELVRFIAVAPRAIGNADLSDLTQLDAAVATALGPLADAVATLEGLPTGDAIGTGWPDRAELERVGALAGQRYRGPASSAANDSDDPCDEALRADCLPLTQQALAAACAGGAAAPEAIRRGAALASAAKASSWLSDEERSALDRRAAEAIAAPPSETTLRLLGAMALLLDLERRLAASPDPPARSVLVGPIRTVLFPDAGAGAGVAFADDPGRLARVIERMAESIEIAIAARSRDDERLPRELRPFVRPLQRTAARTEEATFRSWPRMLADANALTSPEFTGLVQAQRNAVADLDRLADAQASVDAISGVRPQAARGVMGRLVTLFRRMGEATRRDEAARTFDALRQQIALFAPLPYEAELRRETPEAVSFAAGEPRRLVEAIDLARANWADAWAAGDGSGPAAQRLHRLYRLTKAMEDLSTGGLPESRAAAATLSRWGAFHSSRSALAPALTDLTALTKLATQAALAGEDARLDRELDQIARDTPLVQIAARLVNDLGPWLLRRPEGAIGPIAAVRTAPTPDAWGTDLRLRLATLARFARELEELRRQGPSKLEEPLVGFLRDVATSLLDSLGSPRSPVAALPVISDADTGEERGRRRR
jgi:hypothetical protein